MRSCCRGKQQIFGHRHPDSAVRIRCFRTGIYRTPLRIRGQWGTENVLAPEMHLCVAGCAAGRGTSLVLRDGVYLEPPSADSVYAVEKFTRQQVILRRTDKGQYPGVAVLTGQISNDGNHIANGRLQWIDHKCWGLTSGPFQAAWGDAIGTVPGKPADSPRAPSPSVQSGSNQTKAGQQTRSPILVPPGAAPEYAHFPADIRAALRPEWDVPPSTVKLACENAGAFDGKQALEFSRFAFRATNFALGYCLAQRGAGLGESRAHILLGIAEMMGWGTAKSGEAAFHSFDTAANAGEYGAHTFSAGVTKKESEHPGI
jgi:hypothetical protein